MTHEAKPFTPKQGQYLAFIDYYTRIHGRAPAEADLQRFFCITPPVVHRITRSAVLPVVYVGEAKDPRGNQKLAFETEITLDRKEYGLTWNRALEAGGFLVGDDVV